MVKPAHVIFISNPYEPLRDSQTFTVDFPSDRKKWPTVRGWLKANKIPNFSRPTICLFNGKPILRKQWSRKIRPGDVVNFVTCVSGDPITWLWIAYVALIGVTVVLALNAAKLPGNLTSDTPGADPVYTLKGQRNQIRLGEPIEVAYGRPRTWPSTAAQTFNQYIDGQQWRFQLFSLGQGVFTIHDINIEDTPIAEFRDVEWEVIPPGSPVTLFPTNVLTVAEVAGIELLGTNEGSGGAYVIDSEGDPDAVPPIPETGHYNASLSGPFVVNPTLTQTDRIEVDIQLPRGLYKQNNDGTLANLTITALFEAQQIDNSGAAIGAWFTLNNWTKTLNTITPQRYTLSADVTPGRYRIRASRTNTKDTSAQAGNVLIWEAVRAFLPDSAVDPSVTRLAVKARASNNLNDNSANRVNVVATRHLPVWNGTTWTLTATRNPVWAFVDAFRADYGARLADSYLDLSSLLTLATASAARGETFDWVFESKTTVWDIARTIAASMRAVPMLDGSRITMVRDEVKTFPVAVFNQENILKDSFSWEIKLAELQPYDGLRIVYTDADTWKEASVLCCLPDESGNNAESRKFPGITNRTQAYRLGMYLRSLDRYAREQFKFETGLEGHIPSYGDMVAVSHDVPRWGTEAGGFVLSMSKTWTGSLWQYVFTLSEPFATFTAGTRALLIRNKVSAAIGYYVIGPGPGAGQVFYNTATADAALDGLVFEDRKERPLYIFGTPTAQGRNVVLTGLTFKKEGEASLEARPYDSRLFAYDSATPPAEGETNGHLPANEALPAVSGLRVVRAPIDEIDGGLFVAASWFAMPNAQRYLVQFSYDAETWEEVGSTEELTISFAVTARYLYVRVAAINTAQGDWAFWTGNAPITDTAVAGVPSGLVASSAAFVVIQPDGTAVPRVKLTWTAPSDDLVKASGRIRIQYKVTADTDWTDWGTVQGAQVFDFVSDVVAGTAYNFRIRSENKFGGVSAWVTPGAGAHTVAGDSTVAAAVPNTVSAIAFKGYTEIAWSASSSPQVNEYEIFRATVNTFGSAVKIGETSGLWFDDSGFVGGLTAGTRYYYWIRPVSGSNVAGSVHATSAFADALAAPLSGSVPSSPTAPTVNGGGTYDVGGGSVMAWINVRVQPLPANAVWQNIVIRVAGGGGETIANTNKNASANFDIRIDDLSPGVSYEVGVQAGSGAGSSAVVWAASSFTAATKSTGAAAPASGSVNSKAAVITAWSSTIGYFGARAEWPQSASKDVLEYEVKCTTTNSDAATDYVWFSSNGTAGPYKTNSLFFDYYRDNPTTGHVRVRAYNASGVAGAWTYCGELSSVAQYLVKTMALQEKNAVDITGGTAHNVTANSLVTSSVKTGGSGARQVLARYVESVVLLMTGGAAYEDKSISISGRGFTTKPDVGSVVVSGTDTYNTDYLAFYNFDNGGNSSSSAWVKIFRPSGANVEAGRYVRLSVEFIQYA